MLNKRESTILNLIIESFLGTGLPVGSRTIEKTYNIGLSSATIRNVMSDLEEMGLITKTHHSSGRIPSGSAIEEYVNDIIKTSSDEGKTSEDILADLLEYKHSRLENLLLKAGDILLQMTQYAALIYVPGNRDMTITDVFVKNISDDSLLLVIVIHKDRTETIVLDKKFLNIDEEIFNNFLELNFKGKSISYFRDNLHRLFKENFFYEMDILETAIKSLKKIDGGEDELVLQGITKLLDHPDFTKFQDVRQVAELMEDSSDLKDLLKDKKSTGIKVYVEEDEGSNLKNMSLITSSFNVGGGQIASFGILAPIRMDYVKAVNAIISLDNGLKILLNDSLKDDY